jgi:hypothetical protein
MISTSDGLMVHFAETHDNPRLAAQSHTYARMRTALCALASHEGAFGFANGLEWLAVDKINVHEARSLNWGAPVNQVADVRRLTTLLRYHPAFHDRTEMKLIEQGDGNLIVILRHHPPSGTQLSLPLNLDPPRAAVAAWDPGAVGLRQKRYTDLLTGKPVEVSTRGGLLSCALEPGQVLCLSPQPADLDFAAVSPPEAFAVPPRIELQRLRAKALQAITFYRGSQDLADIDADAAASLLKADPTAFCAGLNLSARKAGSLLAMAGRPAAGAHGSSRTFPEHVSDTSPRGWWKDHALGSRTASRRPTALILPVPPGRRQSMRPLMLWPCMRQTVRSTRARCSCCPAKDARGECTAGPSSTGAHAVSHPAAAHVAHPGGVGTLASCYDTLLAANLSPTIESWDPVQPLPRRLVYQGYSQESTSIAYRLSPWPTANGIWRYKIGSQGQHVHLTVGLAMIPGEIALQMTFAATAPAGPCAAGHSTPCA